jgi:hypothetical protein
VGGICKDIVDIQRAKRLDGKEVFHGVSQDCSGLGVEVLKGVGKFGHCHIDLLAGDIEWRKKTDDRIPRGYDEQTE